MNLEALALNVMRTVLEKGNLGVARGHAFRRELATNVHRLGVSHKVI